MDGNSNGGGGGLFMYDGSSLNIKNFVCKNNQVSSDGGCMAVSAKSNLLLVTIFNGTFSNNTAKSLGGAFYLVGNIQASISNSIAKDNVANFRGGFALLDKGVSLTSLGLNVSNSIRPRNVGFGYVV